MNRRDAAPMTLAELPDALVLVAAGRQHPMLPCEEIPVLTGGDHDRPAKTAV